ncbi:hypothetical protein SEA_CASSITA_86 [Microbacterium phage Cassita]|nr:hypothetical protein SEA_CASSITA_86 [Microbacterium phage Cassita]
MITDYKELANVLRIEDTDVRPGLSILQQAANALEELGEAFLRERAGKEAALEGLYKVYVNLGEDTDGARNAKELFGPWVGFDPATHIPDLVMEHRKEWENAYEEGYEDAKREAYYEREGR